MIHQTLFGMSCPSWILKNILCRRVMWLGHVTHNVPCRVSCCTKTLLELYLKSKSKSQTFSEGLWNLRYKHFKKMNFSNFGVSSVPTYFIVVQMSVTPSRGGLHPLSYQSLRRSQLNIKFHFPSPSTQIFFVSCSSSNDNISDFIVQFSESCSTYLNPSCCNT